MASFTFALPAIVIVEVEADSEAEALAAATAARDLLQEHDAPFLMDLMSQAGEPDYDIHVHAPVVDFQSPDEPVTTAHLVKQGGDR